MKRHRKEIKNNLRKHRRLMGFSQADVVQKLQVKSTAMISRWERGQTMPSAENLLKLSILYKTLANELYWELGKEYQRQLFPQDELGGKYGNRDP